MAVSSWHPRTSFLLHIQSVDLQTTHLYRFSHTSSPCRSDVLPRQSLRESIFFVDSRSRPMLAARSSIKIILSTVRCRPRRLHSGINLPCCLSTPINYNLRHVRPMIDLPIRSYLQSLLYIHSYNALYVHTDQCTFRLHRQLTCLAPYFRFNCTTASGTTAWTPS